MSVNTVNIKSALASAAKINSDSARLDVELLLCHTLKKPRTFLFAWPDYELTPAQGSQFRDYVHRRASGEPIAFIVGKKSFWTLELEVDPSTLIPRPDTELLVEQALRNLPEHKALRVLDLGTGTGAIALAVAAERPQADVVAVDCSLAAVQLATRNGQTNRIKNVTVRQSDWFSEVDGLFDLIISNPPYICESDPHLIAGDVSFEPRSALVAADNGLADIRAIVGQAPAYLRAQGRLLIEHGWLQALSVQKIFSENTFSGIKTWKDLNHNDRVTGGVVSP